MYHMIRCASRVFAILGVILVFGSVLAAWYTVTSQRRPAPKLFFHGSSAGPSSAGFSSAFYQFLRLESGLTLWTFRALRHLIPPTIAPRW